MLCELGKTLFWEPCSESYVVRTREKIVLRAKFWELCCVNYVGRTFFWETCCENHFTLLILFLPPSHCNVSGNRNKMQNVYRKSKYYMISYYTYIPHLERRGFQLEDIDEVAKLWRTSNDLDNHFDIWKCITQRMKITSQNFQI